MGSENVEDTLPEILQTTASKNSAQKLSFKKVSAQESFKSKYLVGLGRATGKSTVLITLIKILLFASRHSPTAITFIPSRAVLRWGEVTPVHRLERPIPHANPENEFSSMRRRGFAKKSPVYLFPEQQER